MSPQSAAISRRVEIAFTGLRKGIVALFFHFFLPFIFQASTDNVNVKCFDRKWVFFISTSNVVIVFIVDFWDDETEIRGSIYVESDFP